MMRRCDFLKTTLLKSSFDLVVVIPIGPGTVAEYLRDTITSVRFYTSASHKIILADDSQKGIGNELKEADSRLDVLDVKVNLGKLSGLYRNLAHAYQYALEQYDFRALLRMDDDALVIGPEPQEEAVTLFETQPEIGMAGRHIVGRMSPGAYDVHDNYWPRKQLIKDTCSWKMIRRPRANWALRKVFLKALDEGYELGENVFGGVYFISRACIQKLADAGYLPHPGLRGVNLEEDHLFSLLTCATGLHLGDLSGPRQPFGVAWRGLPASPDMLHRDGRKLIHSTRFWKAMKEDDIRAFFRAKRAAVASKTGAAPHFHEV